MSTRTILVIGAGKSTSQLVNYFLNKATAENLEIIVGDISIENAQKLIGDHPKGKAIALDVFNESQRAKAIQEATIVVSMLPARFHIEVARDCITYNKSTS